MKKVVAAISILLLSAVVHAQQEIKIDELAKHVGDSVTVCTKIYGGIFLDRTKDTPTLLNAGGKYPDAPLTVVIWADARAKKNSSHLIHNTSQKNIYNHMDV